MLNFALRALFLTAAITVADSQEDAEDIGTSSNPSPVYPTIGFHVQNVDHVFLRQNTHKPSGNSSMKAQTFLISGPVFGLLQPTVNASYGPLTVDAPINQDLLLSGRRILPVILLRQVRSSSPIIRILFHMPTDSEITRVSREDRKDPPGKAKDEAHCMTAYAFWETREVRGSCLVSPGGFCVAQLKPEPAWFSSVGRSREATAGTGGVKGLQGNLVEIYFQSRGDQTGQCAPQDSLRRMGVGRGGRPGGLGTPMRRIGSVNLIRTPLGNPTFLRLKLGGAVVIQTSSRPLKTTEVATFYVFLPSTSTLENFTLRATVKKGLVFSAARPSDSALWDVVLDAGRGGGATGSTISVICRRKLTVTAKRGLLEVLQLDFTPKEVYEPAEGQLISWRLELPGNVKDVGVMRIYTTQRDYVGLAPLIMNSDVLNTAVLTGKMVSVPVKTLAVEADGSVADVTDRTSCRSTDEDALRVSERCDRVYVNGTETRGKTGVLVNFTYGFLSAQLEVNVWMPRLPLLIDVADPELSQIKGWRVPITTGSRKAMWDSEEEEEMRKGRGCMLQYQHSVLRVLTPFIAQSEAPPDPLSGGAQVKYFLGPDWQVDVTNLVRNSVKVSDPEVARVQDGVVLQGQAVGTTTVQVVSPLTSSVLAERTVRVLEDKVSVMELGVQLVSGLSLSLQLSPGSNRAVVATAATREIITQLKQEAVISCWVLFSDGAVTPLELFDRSVYALTVSTPDEEVATVRHTPRSTFVVARGIGEGQGALVRVELRICEECQKFKRKSKLAAGTGLLRINIRSDSEAITGVTGGIGTEGGVAIENVASELMREPKAVVTSRRGLADWDRQMFRSAATERRESNLVESTTTATFSTTRHMKPQVVWIGSTSRASRDTAYTINPTMAPTTPETTPGSSTPTDTTVGLLAKGDEQRRNFGNMLDDPNSVPKRAIPKVDLRMKKEPPRSKTTPRFVESDLIRTFRAMSDLEIGMYALVGVSCVAIFAFIFNCAFYNFCFRRPKTPIQAGPMPSADPKDHKHDWVWLDPNNHCAPSSGGAAAQMATLKREAHRPLLPRCSIDSMGHHGLNNIPSVCITTVPERTATLGRSRSSSQQHMQAQVVDPMASRSATLLAKPQRNEPLHSPTSKRNQVQFTTFTTLDIKHLAALKKNGVELNWTHKQHQAPQIPLPDIPWPGV
ncbi:transmembrane protein 132D-like [Genypterus blacodes]|uniref:transmembrane protein 132D-like n=1 Tax=Genypterus blacodes TaxID=154954 RepID=UPI003F76C4B0